MRALRRAGRRSRRGAAYTFMVLASLMTMLLLGGALQMPINDNVKYSSMRFASVAGLSLAEGGVRLARGLILAGAVKPGARVTRELQLEAGTIAIELFESNGRYQVTAVGTPKEKVKDFGITTIDAILVRSGDRCRVINYRLRGRESGATEDAETATGTGPEAPKKPAEAPKKADEPKEPEKTKRRF